MKRGFKPSSVLEIGKGSPSDFYGSFNSVFNKSEYEIIANNIMTILERVGNTWKKLPWKTYKRERMKDGAIDWHVEAEREYFDGAVLYCVSPEKAAAFCPRWLEISEKFG